MLSRLLVVLIRFYQGAISPWLGPHCRYTPTCSTYMRQCIERFGPIRGVYLGIRRLLRCHPFSGSGYDPPPKPHKLRI